MVSCNTTDSLFSKCIRTRDGACRAAGYPCSVGCSAPDTHQAAHIYSRSYRSMRWHPLNCICLCAAHHMYFTKAPIEWSEFCEKTLGKEWVDALMELKRGHSRIKIPKKAETAYRAHFRKTLETLQEQRNQGEQGYLTFKPMGD